MNHYIYLASPYSKYHLGREAAFDLVTREAARFMAEGIHVFAPITHSHPIQMNAERNGIPLINSWEFWRDVDLIMIRQSAGLVVMMLEGWEESVGVTAEIEYAQANGIPVLYHEPGAPIVAPSIDLFEAHLPDLRELAEIQHGEVAGNGFYDGEAGAQTPANHALKAALLASEGMELFEAARKSQLEEPCDKTPELTNEEEEVADIFLRLLDYCGWRGVDLTRATRIKNRVNLERARKSKAAGERRWEGKAF